MYIHIRKLAKFLSARDFKKCLDFKTRQVHVGGNDHEYADVHLLLVPLISQEREAVPIIQHRFHQQRKIRLGYHLKHDKKKLVESYLQSSNTSNHDLKFKKNIFDFHALLSLNS